MVDTKESGNVLPRVAIVDDDGMYAEYLSLKLQDLGFESDCYTSADVFYDRVYQEPSLYSYILVDRFIGQFDAMVQDFAAACKKAGFSGRILLISSVQQDALQAARKGFDRAVKKAPNLDFKKIFASFHK